MMSNNNPNLKPTNPKDRIATSRLDISLFPQTAICYGALGMVEGDSKYGGYNYRVGGVLVSVYVSACLRHIFDYFNGSWADAKTKVPHLGSALACLAIIIDAHELSILRDDRPPKADIRKLLTEFEVLVKHLHETFPDGPSRYTEIEHGNTQQQLSSSQIQATNHQANRKASKKKVSKMPSHRVDSIRTRKRRG